MSSLSTGMNSNEEGPTQTAGILLHTKCNIQFLGTTMEEKYQTYVCKRCDDKMKLKTTRPKNELNKRKAVNGIY